MANIVYTRQLVARQLQPPFPSPLFVAAEGMRTVLLEVDVFVTPPASYFQLALRAAGNDLIVAAIPSGGTEAFHQFQLHTALDAYDILDVVSDATDVRLLITGWELALP